MLWSLIKILIFVAAVVAVLFGLQWLVADGSDLMLAFGGYEVTLGPIQTLVAALVLVVAIWVVFRLLGFGVAVLRFIFGDETAISRYFNRARERRGYRNLKEGMLALAAGDSALAMKKGLQVEKLLADGEVGTLLAAQAAEQKGDRKLAADTYKKLLENPKTRFVAVRGLMRQKQAEGDEATAMKLAESALKLNPKDTETADQLFLMQAHDADWSGARTTLAAKKRYGSAPKELARRRDGLLALCQSMDARKAGKLDVARASAFEAQKLLPGFAPAAVEAAKGHLELKSPMKAGQILRAAWAVEPHPALAAAYAEIVPDETPAKRIKRFSDLVRRDPQHPEARMLMAELSIAAEDFPAARKALGDLVETQPTSRVMTLMAAIERGQGGDEVAVKAWLARAVTAPRGKQWVCENDGVVYPAWQPCCDLCGGFDTLVWKAAPESEVVPDSSAAMLPLIVGAISAVPAEEVTDADTLEGTATEAGQDVPEKDVETARRA